MQGGDSSSRTEFTSLVLFLPIKFTTPSNISPAVTTGRLPVFVILTK